MKSTLLKFFYAWHRRVGATAAIFFIWIVLSGWLLNHAEFFNLQQTQIQSTGLARWYGLSVTTPSTAFTTEHHWLVANEQSIFLDGHTLKNSRGLLLGSVEIKKNIILLTSNHLYLLTEAGDQLDKLDISELPLQKPNTLARGCDQQPDVFVLVKNNQSYASQDGLEWTQCQDPIQLSEIRALTPDEQKQLEQTLTPKISLEKIILDLHTGRFFGAAGVFVVDLLGFVLLFLASTGFWMFLKRRKK